MSGSTLAIAGFVVIAAMIAAYALLDGFDLGVGAIALWIGKTDRERAAAMESIGPFWNGNEVWLIAAGGALFALFPHIYASSFSGFYLPLIVVLWLLMFRGIALELRGHFTSELWHQFWDVAFSLASALLIVLFGVALGNLLRGVPLDRFGYFQGTFGFLLNPYALGTGIFALVTLANHGAAFLALRVDGALEARSRALQSVLWWIQLPSFVLVTAATFWVRGAPPAAFAALMVAIALAALVTMRVFLRRGSAGATFAASCAFVAALLIAAASSMYPYLLPGYPLGSGGLSIFDVAPGAVALATALVVTVGGGIVVIAYGSVVAYKMFGKAVPRQARGDKSGKRAQR